MIVGSNSSRYRVAVVTCYFGCEPWYFRLFQQSCRHNPDIDFILFTDIEFQDPGPPNLFIKPCSLAEIKQRAHHSLGFETALDQPYKLCDFKPAYGLLFSDHLRGYDFWGHADIDLVYGDIRHFITDELLDAHDLVTLCNAYVTGFFTLFRNNQKMNGLFRQSKDYVKVFREPANFCFDECNWQWIPLVFDNKTIFQVPAEIESMTYVVKKLSFCGEVRAYFNNLSQDTGRLQWQNGKLTCGSQEILLYHFIKFKGCYFKYVPSWRKIPDVFFINEYHLSRFNPSSPIGWMISIWMSIARRVFILYNRAIAWLQWKYKQSFSRKRIRVEEFADWRDTVGNYQLQEDNFALAIVERKGLLFAQIGNNKTIPLFHRTGRKFVLGKFRPYHDSDPETQNDMNFDIEFVPRHGGAFDIRIKYHRSNASILQRK